MLILKGAGSMLRQFRFIKTETADFEIYKGCCTLGQLGEFLEEIGFKDYGCSIFASKRGSVVATTSYTDVWMMLDGHPGPKHYMFTIF